MYNAGYFQNLATFLDTDNFEVIGCLEKYVNDANESQIRAWQNSIEVLKESITKLSIDYPQSLAMSSIILEYTIPLETRRIDAVLLLNGVVIVLEFKRKKAASTADIDQAAGYARDLISFHKECNQSNLSCALVMTEYEHEPIQYGIVNLIGSDSLHNFLVDAMKLERNVIRREAFLSSTSYQPQPSLISAARALLHSGTLKRIYRSASITEKALSECFEIIQQTALNNRRALIIVSGLPGTGKTLVGLQIAHSNHFDDYSVKRHESGIINSPAIYLSGNGPLIEVLQTELSPAGGNGKTFVQSVYGYIHTFSKSSKIVPPHHIIIFDEAQRAFDAGQIERKHRNLPDDLKRLSEPELIIRFAERIPDWCVVVGLIGTGQEIHIGEEEGLDKWEKAIVSGSHNNQWDVYIPNKPDIRTCFNKVGNLHQIEQLELSTTLRFKNATHLSTFVDSLLDGNSNEAKEISTDLEMGGYHLRLTHDLQKAKKYLFDVYADNQDSRFGLVASSRDKDLQRYGVPNDYNSPKNLRKGQYGRWYVAPRLEEGSCTRLEIVATEFATQGLELDAVLLAWGTDLIRENDVWTNRFSRNYSDPDRIIDAMRLRKNAYRVLLTRGRDGCVVFVPPIKDKMRETYLYLRNCGFRELV